MSERITLEKIEKDLDFFKKMYDEVRLVDPIGKVVLEQRGLSIEDTNEICYNYWKDEKICDNCISVHAYKSNKSFIKLEKSPDVIMMVTAIPVEVQGQSVVLELLKNATDSMMVGTGIYEEGEMMRTAIERLNEMVVKDPLTSLFNRRFVDDRLPVDIVRATVNTWPLSVLFIDVDNLKSLNDTYGHIVGDMALKIVGEIIEKNIRSKGDWAARYGGDEFIVSLNNTTNEEAQKIGQRISKGVEEARIPIGDKKIDLGISIGLHTMDKIKLTPEELIKHADKHMYISKNNVKD